MTYLWGNSQGGAAPTAVPLGAGLGFSAGALAVVAGVATAAETAAGLVPANLSYPVGHAWRYLNVLQMADVIARSMSIDVGAALNNGVKAAWVNGVSGYIPGGAYSISVPLALPAIAGETRGNAFILYGDGAGDPFSAASFTQTTTIVASGSAVALTSGPGGGAGTGTGNMVLKDMRFEANNATKVIDITVLSDSTFERINVLQSGTGDGIDIGWSIANTFRNLMVMNSGKTTTGGVKTGVGIYITQAGGDAALTTLEACVSAGYQTGFKIGDGAHPIESTRLVSCAAQTATNGYVISAGCNKTVLDTCYSENISGTVVIDNGNFTSVEKNFYFPGFAIGIDGTGAGIGSTNYHNNVLEMGVAGIGIKCAGASGASPLSTSVKGNSFQAIAALAGITGISINGASPQVQLGGNSFYPNTWVGAGSALIVDNSTGLGVIGETQIQDASFQFPVMANAVYQPAWTGVPVTAASVSAGTMTLPAGSVIALNEPTTATSVSAFATTKSRIVTFYGNFNGKFTFTSGATVTLARPWNSPFGTLTLWLYDAGGGVMNAFEIGRSEFNGGGAVTQITSRTTAVTLNKTSGAVTMFSAAGSATAATFTVNNSQVVATDTILLNQASGTNLYNLHVTAVAAGSFNVTFYTTGGTATDAPVINFAIVKGAA